MFKPVRDSRNGSENRKDITEGLLSVTVTEPVSFGIARWRHLLDDAGVVASIVGPGFEVHPQPYFRRPSTASHLMFLKKAEM